MPFASPTIVRRAGITLIAGACAALLTTVGVASVSGATSTTPAPPAPVSPLPILPPVTVGASTAGLTAALQPALADPALPPPVGVMVADGASGTILLDSNGSVPLVPASTAKLLTAVTALVALDDDGSVTTRVVRDPDGAVVLVGAGDPLLTAAATPTGASLTELALLTAAALRQAGVAEVAVTVDDSAFTGPVTAPGWEEGDVADCLVKPITALSLHATAPAPECVPDLDPSLTAGTVFAELLGAQGITVVGEPMRRQAAPNATELAAAQSAPVAAMVEQMLTDSDNTSAEMLAHLAGRALAGQASFDGGSKATSTVLKDLSLPAPGLVLVDGSGLSVLDRLTPSTALGVLDKVTQGGNQQLWPVSSGLAVAGFDGTLAERFTTPETLAGRGDVRAKTGTLTAVSALSGQVVSKDGQLLTFVMISNGVEDVLASREALDRAAAVLAECGCR